MVDASTSDWQRRYDESLRRERERPREGEEDVSLTEVMAPHVLPGWLGFVAAVAVAIASLYRWWTRHHGRT